MRFVFVTDELPRPGSAGHLALSHAIIDWLRQGGHHVTVLLTRPRLAWPVTRYAVADLMGYDVKTWKGFVFTSGFRVAAEILARRVLAGLPKGVAAPLRHQAKMRHYGAAEAVLGAFITPAQTAWCVARIGEISPDAVFVDNIFRAPLLREAALRGLNSVIGAPDLFHERHRAMLAAGYSVYPAQLPREMEAELLSAARAIAAIQPEEAARIRAMCPRQSVCMAAVPARLCPPPAGQKKHPFRLVFVGSDTLPNIDGLRWFFAEAWPRLRALLPQVTLDLAGDCATALRLPAGVVRLGRVENLAEVLHRAVLAIAPLRVSSGLKIKILDYARHGLATVMTPESSWGFAVDAAAPFIVASGGAAFADAIAAKLTGPDPADGPRALAYVATHYNADRSFAGLGSALGIPRA